MNKIWILEGPDGVGKTTLANEIADQTKGHVLHCSYDQSWNMQDYFSTIMNTAELLAVYQDVIIDRWAPSEWVYGNVFRGAAAFDVFDYIKPYASDKNIKWIMCKNVNAVANHIQNQKIRPEMFNDMTDVVANFSLFESDTPELGWIDYDYDKVDMKEFVKELVK